MGGIKRSSSSRSVGCVIAQLRVKVKTVTVGFEEDVKGGHDVTVIRHTAHGDIVKRIQIVREQVVIASTTADATLTTAVQAAQRRTVMSTRTAGHHHQASSASDASQTVQSGHEEIAVDQSAKVGVVFQHSGQGFDVVHSQSESRDFRPLFTAATGGTTRR